MENSSSSLNVLSTPMRSILWLFERRRTSSSVGAPSVSLSSCMIEPIVLAARSGRGRLCPIEAARRAVRSRSFPGCPGEQDPSAEHSRNRSWTPSGFGSSRTLIVYESRHPRARRATALNAGGTTRSAAFLRRCRRWRRSAREHPSEGTKRPPPVVQEFRRSTSRIRPRKRPCPRGRAGRCSP